MRVQYVLVVAVILAAAVCITADYTPTIEILSPQDQSRIWVEPHGLHYVEFSLHLKITNFAPAFTPFVHVYIGEQRILNKQIPLADMVAVDVWTSFEEHIGPSVSGSALGGLAFEVDVSLIDGHDTVAESQTITLLLTSTHFQQADGTLMEHTGKNFVYLMMVKKEVPLEEVPEISQRSDFLQLVWGPQEPTLANAVWGRNLSWSQGRNRLLEEVKRRGIHYKYLIFLDDDASLSLTPDREERWSDPYHRFEDMLLEWMPAVGFAKYSIQQGDKTYLHEEGLQAQCVRFADPLFVAYHFEAAAFLLPYAEHFDNVSWLYSTMVVNLLQSVYFGGHVFQFNEITVHDNPEQEGYASMKRMDWQIPFVWLTSAVSGYQQVQRMEAGDLSKVKCETEPQKGAISYIVPKGQFDMCHQVFSHLRAKAYRVDCVGWNAETKITMMLLQTLEDHEVRLKRLEDRLSR